MLGINYRGIATVFEAFGVRISWVVEGIRQLIDELPQDGSRRLFELWMGGNVRHKGRESLTPVDQRSVC